MELEQVAPAAEVEPRARVEAKFIERLKKGEAAAFEELVTERSGEIYGLLFRLTENSEEARDLTQETFLRAFQNIGGFRGEADLRTWIYRIAINQARNRWRWWRRRRRDSTVSLDATQGQSDQTLIETLAESSENPEQQTLAHERELALRSALQKVGRAYRETVILRDIEELSTSETAAALDLTEQNVKVRLHRGRAMVRGWLFARVGPEAKNAFSFMGVRCDRVVHSVFARLAEMSSGGPQIQ